MTQNHKTYSFKATPYGSRKFALQTLSGGALSVLLYLFLMKGSILTSILSFVFLFLVVFCLRKISPLWDATLNSDEIIGPKPGMNFKRTIIPINEIDPLTLKTFIDQPKGNILGYSDLRSKNKQKVIRIYTHMNETKHLIHFAHYLNELNLKCE